MTSAAFGRLEEGADIFPSMQSIHMVVNEHTFHLLWYASSKIAAAVISMKINDIWERGVGATSRDGSSSPPTLWRGRGDATETKTFSNATC